MPGVIMEEEEEEESTSACSSSTACCGGSNTTDVQSSRFEAIRLINVEVCCVITNLLKFDGYFCDLLNYNALFDSNSELCRTQVTSYNTDCDIYMYCSKYFQSIRTYLHSLIRIHLRACDTN